MTNVGGVELDEFKDAYDDGKEPNDVNPLFTQEMIGEFEDVFHDAHDNYVQKLY